MENRLLNKRNDDEDEQWAKWSVYYPPGEMKVGGQYIPNREVAETILSSLMTAASSKIENEIILSIAKLGKGWEIHALPVLKVKR